MKRPALAGAFALALCFGAAEAQVVADSACEKYAVDIAAFATCDSPTRVARADAEEHANAAPPPAQTAPETRPTRDLEEAKKKATVKPSSRRRAAR